MAQLVQSDLAKIGIKVSIQTLDPSAVSAAKKAGNYDMTFGLYTTDISDPDEIARFAGTKSGGSNMVYTGFTSPELESLANKASSTDDEATRKAAYFQMQKLVTEQAPFVPLYYSPSMYSYSSKVTGFHPGATGNYFLENVKLSN